MRKVHRRSLTLAVASLALVAGAMAGTAVAGGAAPLERAAATNSVSAASSITTWTGGNVRTGPGTDYGVAYTVGANQSLSGVCWLEGGHVSDSSGIAHNKWVRLSDGNYIWGGLLKGNETGGVSAHC
ncbi:SH3 domain-containing protein [Streptomyces sp. 8K308]|uniref:SH3 domain-containing protein n=1 Tax=Streptomyces sp. 8K308 TaxID=2530388 RepID=UPI00104D39B2|nr:SH3 domain-containing protein [Streptomyces sp. 8K308]TDC20254.1 SH3 domain-containing protein [Streptomyces sp. 8K308]